MGGDDTLISAMRLCGMRVPPNGALDMNASLQLSINYLLKDEYRGFGV